jgi:hypothetical protein
MWSKHNLLNAPAAPAVTWSTTNLAPHVILSGSNLTATGGVGLNSGEAVQGRCDTAISASKIYAEFTINQQDNDGYVGIVIANASESFSGDVTLDANEVVILHGGCWTNYNTYFGPFGANFGFGTGSVLQIAVDPINLNFWVNFNNTFGWNGDVIANQNPATNTGGYGLNSGTGSSLCALGTGPYYFGYSVAYDGTLYSGLTANFKTSTFLYTPPAGFVGFN